ncbi:hypothetical protein DM02DRAFT_614525 [Periconia macrospinosa]|uniref:Uncharacterized protein n=1 Tax=Periconia macrospinosa TaxID=97972 RepID=A0A2V1DSI5_9PLEO|nr:hypothetical protein DM02DRAFT_614525 [Periconia macrospinosa]
MEHELRKSQAQETQNVATALKHMTAYCSGTNSADPTLTHDVTPEDWKKLDRQRLLQQKLPDKHESQINVLRAKQERDIKNKLEKQKQQLEQLDKEMRHQLSQEEYHHAQEQDQLDSVMRMRRKRVEKRWDLRYEMWRKDWEKQKDQSLPGRVPQEEWPDKDDTGYLIHSTSAMAVYNSALTSLLMEVGHKAFETRIRAKCLLHHHHTTTTS